MAAIARNTYLSQGDFKDPINCTLFYLALRKKNLVQGLWRTAGHHKEQAAMLKFLANDFSQPRWQTAASKNAFALLGKQRFGKFIFKNTFCFLIKISNYRICCCIFFIGR